METEERQKVKSLSDTPKMPKQLLTLPSITLSDRFSLFVCLLVFFLFFFNIFIMGKHLLGFSNL